MGSNLATNMVNASEAQSLAAHFWEVNNVVSSYYSHLEKAEELQKSSNLHRKTSWLKIPGHIRSVLLGTLILCIVIAFPAGYLFRAVNPTGDLNAFYSSTFKFMALASFVFALAVAVTRFRIQKSKIDKKADEIMNSAKAEMDTVNEIAQSNKELISSVPVNYRYPMATNYLYEIFRDGRVDNINDALNMYDTQLHRWKMEKMGEQMLSEQKRQTTIMKVVAANTEWSDLGATLDWLFL